MARSMTKYDAGMTKRVLFGSQRFPDPLLRVGRGFGPVAGHDGQGYDEV